VNTSICRAAGIHSIPACLNICFAVPLSTSSEWNGTVTLHGFDGCLYCLWEPTYFTGNHPSFNNILSISVALIQ
jgi:hypothetical protein